MYLRTIRIAVSLLMFLGFLVIFLRGGNDFPLLSQMLLATQFGPSLLKWLLTGSYLAAVGLLVVLLLTLLFGRIYCAVLCPLGILQSVIAFFAKPKKRLPHYHYLPSNSALRYGMLMAVIVSVGLGSLSLLNLVEPFSLFGKLATTLLMPTYVLLRNHLVSLLHVFDIYSVFTITRPFPDLEILLGSLFVLMLLVWSLRSGRKFCNAICPVGTFLGLLAGFSRYRISFNVTACTACGRCEMVCPANCIDSHRQIINASRCLSCFNCLKECPQVALVYAPALSNHTSNQVNEQPKRRLVLKLMAIILPAITIIPLRNLFKWLFVKFFRAPISPTPPGSQHVDRFAHRCTACHLCVSACPTAVLQPAWRNYGLLGLLQPTMDYTKGYCDYQCRLCGDICPTGAILPLSLENKQITQIGKAYLIENRCIVYSHQKDCGACAEVCPTHAVFTKKKGHISYPIIKVEHCIGCGRCEFVCPQMPKAIYVQANVQHAKAEAPYYSKRIEEADSPSSKESEIPNEFPF